MSTILDRICAKKRELIAEQKGSRPISELLKRAKDQAPPRGFQTALKTAYDKNGFGLIAEMKKASPSAGVLRQVYDPDKLARGYKRGGAACLSVLTDKQFFQASEGDLGQARAACDLPVLRKDFMVDTYQVVEARALGADAILLIVAALTDDELQQFEGIALDYGMDVLVEVHDEAEIERALKLKSRLIGINNRDLKTMKTDLATTARLIPKIPKDQYFIVSESGIESPADIKQLLGAGAQGFLIGESLLRRNDVEQSVKILFAGVGVGAKAEAS